MKLWWLIHPDEGDLRAFLDFELSRARQTRLERHLNHCPACSARLATIASNIAETSARLGPLWLDYASSPIVPLNWEEVIPMRSTKRRILSVAITTSVVALLVTTVAVPSMRAVAADWLSVFRTERIAVVQVDSAELTAALQGAQGSLTPELARQLAHVTGPAQMPAVIPMAQAEAADLVGPLRRPAKLPAGLSPEPSSIDGIRSATYTMQPDVDAINAWLSSQGLPARLSSKVKGQTYQVTTPMGVIQTWQGTGNRPFFLAQGVGLQIFGTGSLDLQSIAALVAQIAGVPASITEQIGKLPDLGQTMVLPVGPGIGEQVKVGGTTGVYYPAHEGRNGSAVVWSVNGRTFVVGGDFSLAELLAAAGDHE
jgi:hypothetical protein